MKEIRVSKKFSEDLVNFYPGPATVELRVKYEDYANSLVDRVLELPDNATRDELFALFSETLHYFDRGDTEDRERIGFVCERIMDAVGVESSNGLLNTWLYGFDVQDIHSDA